MDFLGNTDRCENCEWKEWERWVHMCVWEGSSVDDNCIVGVENLGLVCDFTVITMSEGIDSRVPDHSLSQWDIVTNDVGWWNKREERQKKVASLVWANHPDQV